MILGNTSVTIASKATRSALAARPAIILANALALGVLALIVDILTIVLVTVRRTTCNPHFIDTTLQRNNTSSIVALSRVIGAAKVRARCRAQVAGGSRPRASGVNRAGLAVGTARTSPRSWCQALPRFIGTAPSSALKRRGESAVSSRPGTTVHRNARVAVSVAGTSLKIRRKVVAA